MSSPRLRVHVHRQLVGDDWKLELGAGQALYRQNASPSVGLPDLTRACMPHYVVICTLVAHTKSGTCILAVLYANEAIRHCSKRLASVIAVKSGHVEHLFD